jgi:hypothetical protein
VVGLASVMVQARACVTVHHTAGESLGLGDGRRKWWRGRDSDGLLRQANRPAFLERLRLRTSGTVSNSSHPPDRETIELGEHLSTGIRRFRRRPRSHGIASGGERWLARAEGVRPRWERAATGFAGLLPGNARPAPRTRAESRRCLWFAALAQSALRAGANGTGIRFANESTRHGFFGSVSV